jgi:hypothetical protein
MAVELIFGLIPAEWLLYIVCIGAPVLLVATILIQDIRAAKKSLILYFTSEKECEFLNKVVEDGMISVGKKKILVDTSEPPNIKSQGSILKSYRPFHVIKWDKALPMSFTDKGIKLMSGANLQNLLENKTLDKLLQPKGQEKMMLLWLVLGIVIGAIIGYAITKSL